MRHMRSRRILAMLLALSMIFGLLTTSALAANTEDGQNNSVTENTAENQTVGETQKGEGTTGDSETPPTEDSKQEDSKEEQQESAQADPQNDENAVAPIAETYVATVGEQSYAKLEDAFNALSSDNYTLMLAEGTDAWDDATPVYWKVGEGAYTPVASLAAAVKAAYMANEAGSKITIVCKPGANVGEMTHGHVADSITIYGNNAYISGGECDLEVDTYKFDRSTGTQYAEGKGSDEDYLAKDITITGYELDNLGVWGERHTTFTVNVNLKECDGKEVGATNVQRVYISGTTGDVNINLDGCNFITNNTSAYSNADGDIKITNCTFTGTKVPVNFNHTSSGAQTLDVSGCTFTNCGDAVDWPTFAAPVRFVNSGDGKQEATVSKCSFNGTKGSNGDILLGDGREGKPSKDVSLSVFGTAANVVAQKPGYYPNEGEVDSTKRGEQKLTASEPFNTTANELASGTTTELTAYVTVNDDETKYETLEEAFAIATPADNGVITYTIHGKVQAVSGTNGEAGWIQILPANSTTATRVAFVAGDENAEIEIVNPTSILADNNSGNKINVSFEDLTLSHPNGKDVGDIANGSKFFACWLRNTDASENTVTYTNCTFPNGVCNNQYGKTLFVDCKFTSTTGWSLWHTGVGSSELTGCEFTGKRGVKLYAEGSYGSTGDVTLTNVSFNLNDSEKAAVEITKPGKVTMSNVSVSGTTAGTIKKNLDNGYKTDGILPVTVEAIGTGISGTFEAQNKNDVAKEEFNISAGTFNADVSTDYLAEGVEIKDDGNGNYGVTEAASAPTFNEDGTITDVTAKNVQDLLDGKYGSIDGKTIVLSAGEYPQLELGRATKYADSNTTYHIGSFTAEALTLEDFTARKAEGGHYYIRTMENVTFKAEDNATVKIAGVFASSGHKYVAEGSAAVTDYVLDTTLSTPGSSHYLADIFTNIAFEGITFTAKSDINTSIPEAKYDGFTFKNCVFDINNTASDNQAIRYYNENNDGRVTGLTVDTCTFNSCYQGVYTSHVKNVTVTNSTFNTTGHNAIAIQDFNGKCDHGQVVITGNTFTNVGDRIIRFNNVGTGTTIQITGNTSVASGNTKGEIIMATTMAEGVTVDMTSTANTWGDKAEGVPAKLGNGFADSDKVAEVNGVQYTSITEAISKANDGDTVMLIADATEDVTINKSITLDLGGFTLTNTSTGKATISVTGGTVTVKNGSVKGGTGYYNIGVTKGSNANLTLEDVTATAGNDGSSMIDNFGTLTIKSGTYTGGLDTLKNEPGAKLTVTGGTFTLTKGTGSGLTGVIFNYGELTIKDGTFIQSDTSVPYGYAQVVHTDKDKNSTAVPSTTIEGGIFKNLCTRTTAWTVRETNAAAGSTTVSGGQFNKKVTDSYLAEGLEIGDTKNDNGCYTVTDKNDAQIGTTLYKTFELALQSVQEGETIKLRHNVVVSEQIVIDKAIKINLNGHTLTSTYELVGDGEGRYAIVNKKALTIVGSSGNAKIVADKARVIGAYADLTLNQVQVTSALDGGHASVALCGDNGTYNINNKSVLTGEYALMCFANDATVKITGSSKLNGRVCGFYHNGTKKNLTLTATSVTINGSLSNTSSASGYEDPAGVYISGNESFGSMHNVTFTNCTIKGSTAIEVKYTDLTLDTCTVVATSQKQAYVQNNNGSTTAGFAVVSTDNAKGESVTPAPKGTITITGKGKYTGNVGLASLASVKKKFPDFTDNTIKVSGGTFNKAVLQDYCAAGFVPVKNADGTYGVAEGTAADYAAIADGVYYNSFEEALSAVKSLDGSIKLLKNVDGNFVISKALTLDLNGCTINGGTTVYTPALTITARVTIKDSSEAQNGTIMREDTAETSGKGSHYVIDIQGSGWLTFESGNVKNNSGNDAGNGASLVRVGDDSVSKFPGLNIKGGTFTQDNFIAIKVDRGDLFLNGGTINSANSYAIENWHRATINVGTVNGAVASWTYSGGQFSDTEINGGTINGDVTAVNYGDGNSKTAKVTITGGTVNGKLDTRSYNMNTGDLTSIEDATLSTIQASGGTFSEYVIPRYCADGAIATRNSGGTYGVVQQALAMIDNQAYFTWDEAYKAQTEKGGTIVLLRDYNAGRATVKSGSRDRTIDLNGHTWTFECADVDTAAFEINHSNVTLTVKNGNIVSKSMIGLIPSASSYTGTITYDSSGLVFENVVATANGHSGIETNGNNTDDTVVLRNSTLNVPNGFGIYFPSSGTLTIDNSVINAKTMGVQVCAGSLNITGEKTEINVSGDAVPKTENDGAIADGAAISIVSRGYKDFGTIVVKNGKFTAKEGNAALKAYNWDNKEKKETGNLDNTAKIVTVSGGSYSSTFDASLCNEGYAPKKNADGMYVVDVIADVAKISDGTTFKTLAEAVNAANDGDTVTLLADVDANITVDAVKNITLDLNGFTINGGTGTATATITNYGTLTITDSSKAKTGTIKRDDQGVPDEKSYYVILNKGTMTIEQANVVNNSGYRKANSSGSMVGSSLICNGDGDVGATLTINGGTFKQMNFLVVKNGTLGTLNVTGGTFTSNHSAIQNWYIANITGGEINGQLWTDSWEEGSIGATTIGDNAKVTGEIVMDITGPIKPTLQINGGSFDVSWRITSSAANVGAKPEISGGTFNTEVKSEWCAAGFIPTKNSDGTYGVTEGSYVAAIGDNKYTTLEAALKDAKANDTVVLTADEVSLRTVDLLEGVELDLNGKTLKADYITYAGGRLVDSTGDNKGVVKPFTETKDKTTFIQLRGKSAYDIYKAMQIPVYNETAKGFVLVKVELQTNSVTADKKEAGTLQAVFYPNTNGSKGWTDEQKKLFGATTDKNPVTATFRLVYTYEDSEEEQILEFNFLDVFMNRTLTQGGYMFVTVKGLDLVKGFSDITITPVLKSADGQFELYGNIVGKPLIEQRLITLATTQD